MANTAFVELPALSNKIYKEWNEKTVLVQSCDNAFEGELNLETLEIDIPVYHDLSIHLTTIKERELKPAPVEFVKASTKRVTIDKGRYSHWGETNLNKLIDRLSAEDSEVRKKLINKWAREAEKELAEWVAYKLPASQEIDLKTILSWSTTGYAKADNVVAILDVLKAYAIEANMEPEDFKLFTSEQFVNICRDAKITTGANLDANEQFRTGFIDYVNGVDLRQIQVPSITTRNATSKIVEAEWAIWKTKDGIQYVVPYKNTVNYDIRPDQVLLGGKGFQMVEYYDFFNLYPKRLYRVGLIYAANKSYPSI